MFERVVNLTLFQLVDKEIVKLETDMYGMRKGSVIIYMLLTLSKLIDNGLNICGKF